jgi:hypothetical protein
MTALEFSSRPAGHGRLLEVANDCFGAFKFEKREFG